LSLKNKAFKGIFWSFIDSFAGQGINFLVGIALARLLSPREFGLIGMLTIFIAISQSFIDSGFRNALIRKQNCSNTDYSTVFYFNLFVSIICYFILFFIAGAIGEFYHEQILADLIKVLGISLIINAFGIIHSTILTKEIDFKKQTKISLIASLFSGVIAITMAYSGFGVWSLVTLTVLRYLFTTIMFWVYTTWKPIFVFSIVSFKELFAFGSKLLVSGLINTVFENIYYLIIGKYFSAVQLGYYTRADQFRMIPSLGLSSVIGRVSYPVLSEIQNDIVLLKNAYKRIIKSTMLLSFIIMFFLAASSQNIIIVFIGSKWLPTAKFLQLLAIIGSLYPLHALNLNLLQVLGRSDLFLKLEIIKKFLAIPTILIGIYYGIEAMIFTMFFNSLIALFINGFWTGKFINYNMIEQLLDLAPTFLVTLATGVLVYYLGTLIILDSLYLLLTQFMTFSFMIISLYELFKVDDYIYIKNLFFEKLVNFKYGKA